MNQQEKLIFIENYLKTYFDDMLLKDIKIIRDNNLEFTLPYILLVSAGIDFLGSLAKGFNSASSDRSRYFIKEWMGKINDLYNDERMNEIIYKSARCGSSHQAIYKKEIESSSWLYPRDKHLYHMVDKNGKDRVFIHALQFVDDFFCAQNLFRQLYIKFNYNSVHENLVDMIQEKKMSEFSILIEDLKSRGLTFDADKFIQNNPRVKDYNKETLRIKSINGDECIPSVAPEEIPTNMSSSASASASLLVPITHLSDIVEEKEEKNNP